MTAEAVIEIENINMSFGDNHVLRNFSVNLLRGENLVVLGKSGSGKSVLIKCIIGLMTQDSGSIKVFGKEITDLDRDELDKMRVKVGFLFQSNALYDSMTVRENLEFPLRRHWLKAQQNPKEVEDLIIQTLEHVGLAHTIDMMPIELSGGMRKRIALARTLILRPDVILYDEPTTGLDPVTAREISDLIMQVQHTYNSSAIIISHDMNCIDITANRVVMLIEGKCYAVGKFDELKKSNDPKVHEFFE